MHHPGNLIIRTEADAETYKALTSVGGDLYILAEAELDALTSVVGSLIINADARLDALTRVGCLIIRADADLGALTSVGGDLYILADASLGALKSVGGELNIIAGTNVTIAALRKSRKGHLDGMKDASKRIAPKETNDGK